VILSRADVIVVGLGAVGAAAAYQLSKRGARVLGLDRYRPPHDRGSSHGETRITRQGVGEGEAYAPMAIRSHEIWRELEAATGRRLLLTCGLLVLGAEHGRSPSPRHGKSDFVRRSAATAARFGVPHELIAADEVARRYPQFGLVGDELGYFEPGGGLIYPEACIGAQLEAAARLGAALAYDEPALEIDATPHGVRVRTGAAIHEAGEALLCAGAWTPGLAGAPLRRLVLQPQALHWFEAETPADYAPDRFPAFIWMHGDGADELFYGFPIAPDAPTRAVKAATEAFDEISEPAALNRTPDPGLAQGFYDRHVRSRLRGVGASVVRSAACLYTHAPDADFVIGADPRSGRILIASACSGHGFKHSAAVGELLARMLLEGAAPPAPFRLDRGAMQTG
jgi:sarcosine oxidase